MNDASLTLLITSKVPYAHLLLKVSANLGIEDSLSVFSYFNNTTKQRGHYIQPKGTEVRQQVIDLTTLLQ